MKKLLVACDEYVYQVGNKYFFRELGAVLIKRYLGCFDVIRLVVRAKKVENSELGEYNILIDNKYIEVYPIPFFRGPVQLIKKIRCIQRQIKSSSNGCDACVVRLPSTVATMVLRKVLKKKIPYAVEVVASPWDIMKAEKKILLKCIWWIIHRRLLTECKNADCASYVTEFGLQRIYPDLKLNHYETFYSSVELDKEFFFQGRIFDRKETITICHVSNSIQSYLKGHMTVIKVIKKLSDLGYGNLQVKFVGDGPFIKDIISYSQKLGVFHLISFVGFLNKKQLRSLLIESDVMLFPTYTEGLPRVVIEAMATGLPCLSTKVGGIPELISEEYLFEPDDYMSFANKIIEIISNDELYNRISLENYHKALTYEASVLSEKRNRLLKELYNKINC
ncbi:glycosyltransferase family 4 protein [Bacteroides sp.]